MAQRPKSPAARIRTSFASVASAVTRKPKTPTSGDGPGDEPARRRSSGWFSNISSLPSQDVGEGVGFGASPHSTMRSSPNHPRTVATPSSRYHSLKSASEGGDYTPLSPDTYKPRRARPRANTGHSQDKSGGEEELSEAAYLAQKNKQEAEHFERQCFISHLTEADFDTVFGFKWWRGKIKRVDLSSDKFRLETLAGPGDGLMNRKLNLSKCTFMDVSFNRLYDINMLQKERGLESLEVLLARGNHLSSCNLRLPKLVELNLSYNEFRSPPQLEGLPYLQVLMLNHNQLNGEFPRTHLNARLNRLDLGENLYDFPPSEFRRNLELLSDLPDLTNLRLVHNPFIGVFTEYQVFVIKILSRLTMLDGVKIGRGMRRDIDDLGLLSLDNYDDIVKDRLDKYKAEHAGVGNPLGRRAQLPRLGAINDLLLAIVEDATSLVPSVDRLLDLVSVIPQPYFRLDGTDPEETFWMDQPDGKGVPHMNTSASFFELILGVLDRHEFTKDKLCMVLGYLSCVATRDFGYHCMAKLGGLMQGGQQMVKVVLKTLDSVIVPNLLELGKADVKSAQTSVLIKGLVHLLCIADFTTMVAEAIGDCVQQAVVWFKTFVPQENRSVVKLLAFLFESEKNTRAVVDQDLVNMCIEYANNQSMQEHHELLDVWLDIVRLLRNIIRYCPEPMLDIVVERQVHIMFISRARTVRRRATSDSETRSLTWSEIVRTLNALMERRHDVLFDACNSFKYVSELGEHMQEFVVDPLVLAAACRGLTLILREEKLFEEFGSTIVSDLSNVTPLLLYLGGDKYSGLYDRAQHQIARQKGLPPPEHKQAPPLELLRCPICFDAFLALLALFEFFAEAQQERNNDDEPDARSNLIESVNEAMNNNQRETILLGLLVVPMDDVKTAVMQCISKIPSDQLERQELGLIIKLLLETRNISAGSLEDMLIKAINLLERVTGSQVSGAQFRRDQGELAVLAAHSVLLRNAERSTYGSSDEEEEKSKLSLAIISFLRTCSRFPQLRMVLQTNQKIKDSFPDLLKLEEELHSPWMPDISVEHTWTGRSVPCLMAALSGNRALQCDKKQALRVIMRMADIFEGRTDVLEPLGPGPTVAELAKRETTMWDTQRIMHMNSYLDSQEAEHREDQIRVFTLTGGVSRLLNFITRPSNSDSDHALDGILTAVRKHILSIRQKSDRAREDEASAENFETDENGPVGQYIQLEVGAKDEEEEEGQKILLTSIQCHEYEDDFHPHDLFPKSVGSMWREQIFDNDEKGTINYVYILCAAMRLFHALIIAAPPQLNSRTDCMTRASTIAELRQPHVIKLFLAEMSQMAPTSCNVGPKFFRLMSLLFRAVDVGGGQGRLELFGLLSHHVSTLSTLLEKMLLAANDKPQDIRRQHLCAEVAYFVETMVMLIPFQNPRDEIFVVECISWLAPWRVMQNITRMILYDLHTDTGSSFGDAITEKLVRHLYTKADIREKTTRCLSRYLSKRPEHKYDTLYTFTKKAVFRNASLNRAYLNELLSSTDLCKYTDWVQKYLQEQSGDADEFVFSLMPVWVVLTRRPASWQHQLFAISNRRIYLVTPDTSKPPYSDVDSRRWEPSWEAMHPRDPVDMKEYRYNDIAGIYRCYGNQLLSMWWKDPNGSSPSTMCELYAFERTEDRDIFADMVKNNYSSFDSDLSVVPYDSALREEVRKYTGKDPVLVASVTVKGERELKLYVLTIKEMLEFNINPAGIQFPPDSDLVNSDYDFFNPAIESLDENGEVVRASGVASNAMMPMVSDFNSKGVQLISSRSSRGSAVLAAPRRESLKDIQEIVFETDGNPDLLVKFKKGTVMNLRFFVDSGRDKWRRALAFHIARKGAWHRSESEQ